MDGGMSKLPILEIFGPTIQGEGMVIGQKTMFVRTAGCDYSCSWCDSAFTWDGSAKDDIRMMTAEEIWAELKALGGDKFSFVTISGGNPALLKNLDSLIDILKENQISIGIETQGSRLQDWFLKIDELTISPKPPSSKMETNFDVLDSIFINLDENQFENNVTNLSVDSVLLNLSSQKKRPLATIDKGLIRRALKKGVDIITLKNNKIIYVHSKLGSNLNHP